VLLALACLNVAASIMGWYQLGLEDRRIVNSAIDHGERVADPQLRPVAAATAAALLHRAGWRVLRDPLPVILLVVSVVALVWGAHWWILALTVVTAVAVGALAERRARRLRPRWAEAVEANGGGR